MKAARRGFTLVEVVVSLAVIAIVALAATSVIVSAIHIQKNAREKFYAVNLCENAVAIFRAAVDKEGTTNAQGVFENMQTKMEALLGIKPSSTGTTTATASLNSNWEQAAEDAKYNCSLALLEENSGALTFTVEVTLASGASLYAMTYQMGGAS